MNLEFITLPIPQIMENKKLDTNDYPCYIIVNIWVTQKMKNGYFIALEK